MVYFSHTCNELTDKDVDKHVKLVGWVKSKRDHGDLLFIDLYDIDGLTQLVCEQDDETVMSIVKSVPKESVLYIEGKVIKRTDEAINKDIFTGHIEVVMQKVEVLNKCEVLPFEMHSTKISNEELRLKYRFLELRNGLNNILVLRSKVIFFMRYFMNNKDFIEVETPILTGPSPEGARDFIVPSRLHPGSFYALPQAPQIFKQLLMASGLRKYYQIAKCFRDEDLRKDRALEFTQLDIEIAFADREVIFKYIEELIINIFSNKDFIGRDRELLEMQENKMGNKFIRISYSDAVELYGSDKPDLRNPLILKDITDLILKSDLNMFVDNINNNQAVVKSIPAPNTAMQTRKFFNEVMDFAISKGAKGLAYIQKLDGKYLGPIAKRLSSELCDQIFARNDLGDGDSLFFACDAYNISCLIAGEVRNYIAKKLNLYKKGFAFCWVVDFPFFTLDDKTNKLDFNHNPFSMPIANIESLKNADMQELLNIKANQYDLVCNGYEIASGAVRNHTAEGLYAAFDLVGYDKQFVDTKFNSLISGLKYGAPPHGGIALGVDRIIMLLSGKEAVREVVAFTGNQNGVDNLMRAPVVVSEGALKDLSISVNIDDK